MTQGEILQHEGATGFQRWHSASQAGSGRIGASANLARSDSNVNYSQKTTLSKPGSGEPQEGNGRPRVVPEDMAVPPDVCSVWMQACK